MTPVKVQRGEDGSPAGGGPAAASVARLRRVRPRNWIALVLILFSFVLLVPGLIRPLITITAEMELFGATRELFRQTRSIIQTVRTLHESGDDFVAGLILLFSVIVPFAKGVLLLVVLAMRNAYARFRLFRFVRDISKWSMADVFVVGVYVAFLSAKATDAMNAEMHSGFYFFASYCLVSLVALQFMQVDDPRDPAAQ